MQCLLNLSAFRDWAPLAKLHSFYICCIVSSYLFIFKYLFIYSWETQRQRHRERGRDTGRGRSRIPAGSLMQDSIPGPGIRTWAKGRWHPDTSSSYKSMGLLGSALARPQELHVPVTAKPSSLPLVLPSLPFSAADFPHTSRHFSHSLPRFTKLLHSIP